MTIFDLLFIVVFLTGTVATLLAAIAAARGRRERAFRLVRRIAVGAGLYFGVLIVVSLFASGRQLALNEEHCSDDWCISVTRFERRPGQAGDSLEVEFKLTSRAARISQRELHVVAYVLDGDGHRYDPAPSQGAMPFDVRLGPLESVTTTRLFLVPTAAGELSVVVDREGVGRFPRCFIICEEESLLHKRAIVPLR